MDNTDFRKVRLEKLEKIKALGFMYVLSPVFTGVIILLIIALIFNNIPANRFYPYKRPTNKLLQKLLNRSKEEG